MRRDLGPADRLKLNEYLDLVRDVESRLLVRARAAGGTQAYTRPAADPADYATEVRMLIDLQVMALQADRTRVWTFMMGQQIPDRLVWP